MKQFKGRPVVAGKCTAPALVSHSGFNTLASFQGALQFGELPIIGKKYKHTECDDQNNKDLYQNLRIEHLTSVEYIFSIKIFFSWSS